MEVCFVSKELVKPSSPTPSHLRAFKLCLLDQLMPSSYAPIVWFYETSHIDVIKRLQVLKTSLSETLSRFYPLAGKIKEEWLHEPDAIEAELERAIFEAGGIRESNYGNLHKIGWARSTRTDKGVHSLATMITMKMEIPESAWQEHPFGIALANRVNSHLLDSIRVFSILPVQKLDS